MESLLLNERWNPGAGLVVFNKLLLDVSHLDEPGIESSVDQRGVGSPAERITMDDGASADKSTLSLQALLDLVISILDIDALIVGDSLGELTVAIDGDGGFALINKATLNANLVIVLTEARRAMHNTGTSVRGNKVSTNNSEAISLLHALEILEQRNVLLSNKRLTGELLENLVLLDVCLLEDVLESRLGKHVCPLLLLIQDLHVSEVGVDSKSKIAWKCPGCGGPSNEAHVGVLLHWEGNDDGRIVDVLIV